MKATKQYFPVVLFIMLCKVVLTFESADENLKWDQMKAIGKYFPVMLIKVVITSAFVNEILNES